MISSSAMPADRRADDHTRGVTAGLGRGQPDRLQAVPDLRDVLDTDPVQLDVLPVGDVRAAARELLGDLADHPQLLGGEASAVDPHPQHEVLVVQLLRLQDRGLAAVDPGLALGVEAPPAHPAAQVVGVDRVEAALRVDRLNACPHIETVVVLLELLVAVQRGVVPRGPLTLTAVTAHLAAGRCGGRVLRGGGHGSTSFGTGGKRLLPARTGAWVYLRVIARAGEREDVSGDAAARQRTGQMALDMRPRSTCRRLTKAIPVPDMTEACHGDLDTVQLYPPCGHPGLDRRDQGVVGHKDRGASCSRRSGRVGPGPGAG